MAPVEVVLIPLEIVNEVTMRMESSFISEDDVRMLGASVHLDLEYFEVSSRTSYYRISISSSGHTDEDHDDIVISSAHLPYVIPIKWRQWV